MIFFLISLVHLLARIITILVILDIILSYFMSPFSQVRVLLSRIVGPMLAPIRRVMPNTGMLDLSPLVLIVLVQIVEYILVIILRAL